MVETSRFANFRCRLSRFLRVSAACGRGRISSCGILPRLLLMVLLVTGLFSGLGFLLHVRLVRYIEVREKIDLRDEALNLRADLERTLARAERLVWDFTRQPVQPPRQDQSARQPSEEPVILSCVPVQLPELVDPVPRVPVRKQIREYALHETLPEQERDRGAQVFWSDLYWGAAADGQQQALMQVLVRESRAAQPGNDAAEDLAARYWLAEVDMTAALHARVLRNVRCFSLLVNMADVEKTGLCCIPLNNGNPGGLQLLAQQPQPGSPDLQEVHFTVGARLREAISEYRLWQEQPEATTGAAWQYPQEIAEGASTGLRLEDLIQVHGGEFSPPAPWSCRSSEIDLLQDGTLREDQREAVVEITASTGKLRCLIDDLLDAHRLKQGDLHVEQEEIEVRKLLSDIVRRCQAEVKRGVRLSLRSGAEVIVCSDRGKLERIIMNLLLNACKFTTAGTIEVRLERTTDGRVRIDVADTGKGMTAEEQSRVFQVQHTATQRGNRGGTGLGLYICQQLSRHVRSSVAQSRRISVRPCRSSKPPAPLKPSTYSRTKTSI